MPFELVCFSQQDPQWKNDKIGSGPDTIGYVGCALTSVAMYLTGWGFIENPGSLNKKLKSDGGYVGEAIVWSAVQSLYPAVSCTGLTICTSDPAPLSRIDDALAAGQPMIVEVDRSPAAGLQTHWVLLYAKRGNDYAMLDPWPYPSDSREVTLMSRYASGQPLQRAIKAIAWYQTSGASTPPPSTPLPPPVETDLYVQVLGTATAGLRLHSQPSLDSPATAAEMPGTKLRVIEEKTGALEKIGRQGELIYVRDPQTLQGYVAAWYVEQAQPSTPEPVPAPTPPAPEPTPSGTPPPSSEPARLYVTVSSPIGQDGLRLRRVPSMGGTLVAVEKAGTTLTVMEPADHAMTKIGKTGQWVSVRDPNGLRGYARAEYLQIKS